MHSISKTIRLDADHPILKGDGRIKGKEVECRSALEHYIFQCCQALSRISFSIENSKISIAYIKSSFETHPDIEGLTAVDFLQHSIENFIVRSHSIFDRVLIFANRLCHIGLSNDAVSYKAIIYNDHIISHNLVPALKKIKKTCTKYVYQRNSIIHHRGYQNETFDFFYMLHKTNYLSKNTDSETQPVFDFANDLTEEYILEIAADFSDHLESIIEDLYAFYNIAEKVYLEHKKFLRTKI